MKTAIEMAREVGMLIDDEGSSWGSIITTEPDELERFAALARADEREACAQVGMLKAVNGIEVSAAIRARGQDPMPLFDDWPGGWRK